MVSTETNASRYHGRYERPALLLLILGLALFISALARPWYLRFRHAVALSAERVGYADLLAVALAIAICSIYRDLSRKIAEGGRESEFMDRIRPSVGGLLIVAALLLETALLGSR